MCNFFGVRHGKEPCDGCAGRVKQQVSSLVKTEEFVVNSALSFYKVCHSKLQKNPVPNECSHFVQTFYFTLNLSTRPKTGSWPGIPDTCKLHSIVNNPGSKILNIRMKLCCCYNCLHGTGPCTNNVCPEDWSAYDLQAQKAVKPNLRKWAACNVPHNLQTSVSLSWAEQLLALSSCRNYSSLEAYVSQNPLPPLVCNINSEMLPTDNDHIDFVALHYIPFPVMLLTVMLL